MKEFELGMELSYAGSWSPADAIRELLQNAIDAKAVDEDNDYKVVYNPETRVLRVANRKSSLGFRTLLLGNTSKLNNSKTIGTHGEGYKVATNVLLRNNLGVTIYNYANKEKWVARVKRSRTYNTKVGCFSIQKNPTKSVNGFSLVFEVSGISPELWEEVRQNSLFLLSSEELGDIVEGEKGTALLNPKFKGKLYVGGLFVCQRDQFQYGWDIAPSEIALDRDRALVDSFDLKLIISRIILSTKDNDFIEKASKVWDGEYLYISIPTQDEVSSLKPVCDRACKSFYETYGESAVACNSLSEQARLKSAGYNTAYVSSNDYLFITHSDNYKVKKIKPVLHQIETWFNQVYKYIPKELKSEGEKYLDYIKANCPDIGL